MANSGGLPQRELDELKHINNKLADIKQDVDDIKNALTTGLDLTPLTTLLTETNRLLAVLVDNESERKATSLGGTVAEIPNPSRPTPQGE